MHYPLPSIMLWSKSIQVEYEIVCTFILERRWLCMQSIKWKGISSKFVTGLWKTPQIWNKHMMKPVSQFPKCKTLPQSKENCIAYIIICKITFPQLDITNHQSMNPTNHQYSSKRIICLGGNFKNQMLPPKRSLGNPSPNYKTKDWI